ncbi:MAG: alpha/beta hydrolase domain-containing protein [Variovorax sp.]
MKRLVAPAWGPHWRIAIMAALLAALAGCAQVPTTGGAPAVVEQLLVRERQPAFAGRAFGDVGPYERVVAQAQVALDPAHPANRGIVDAAAAASADGKVRYRADVVILRPRDSAKSSGTWVLDVANRGRKLMLEIVNGGSLQTDQAEEAGTGWLMRQGHTLLWIGWQGDMPADPTGKTVGMVLSTATQGGQPITGTALEEIVFDAPGQRGILPLSYRAASLDPSLGELTVRARPEAPPTVIAPAQWRYKDAKSIELDRPTGFDAGAIYQFRYTARDPRPMGLGMASLRDIVSHLKTGLPDASGRASPVADLKPKVTVAIGISQSGRFLRDWVWQGFNAGPGGQRVFDGMVATIAGSRKTYTNVRWAQPGRYSRQHEDHFFYGDQFPFTYATTTDPLSGRRDGLFARCAADSTCPKVFHLDSGIEYWQGRAGLVATDGAGHDIALPDDVRVYLMSSTQHVTARSPTAPLCEVPINPAQQQPVYRALLTRMVEWARDRKAPPASRYPTVRDGTLVPATAAAMRFPDLSALGMALPAPNALTVIDYGTVPARPDPARAYTVLVPRTDADGNDVAGIRLPDIAVPLATYTGWNRRKTGFAPGQLCGLDGSYLPFAADASEAAAKRDPRRSIAERYASREAYLTKVRSEVQRLQADGLMLAEDAERWMENASKDARIAVLP